MPSAHAVLSPSAAERWISCPASVKAAADEPDQESEYAREGTIAHDLAEIKASYAFGYIDTHQYHRRRLKWKQRWQPTDDQVRDMEAHTDAYVDLLRQLAAENPATTVLLEQRLDTGVDSCWGTSDAVLISPQHVGIVDFKYGTGVAVEAEGNPQLRLYGLAALLAFGDLLGDTQWVTCTVHQPRLDHVLHEELTPSQLLAWRDEVVLPAAQEALHAKHPQYGPSDAACRWCPMSGKCRAQLEDVFGHVDAYDNPGALTPADMAQALAKVELVRSWLKAVDAQALAMAYSDGEDIPGWKVVMSAGKRSVVDPDGALRALEAAGYGFDQVGRRSAKGIVDLEKLLGKPVFRELLEDPGFVKKSEGRPSLVPNSDKRQAINSLTAAREDFQE